MGAGLRLDRLADVTMTVGIQATVRPRSILPSPIDRAALMWRHRDHSPGGKIRSLDEPHHRIGVLQGYSQVRCWIDWLASEVHLKIYMRADSDSISSNNTEFLARSDGSLP
jgi:hypothetical protein